MSLGVAQIANGATEDNPKPKAEPVVVTVSARAIPLSASTASVTVVTREQIEQSKAENVGQILREIGLLHTSQIGSFGSLTTVTLRGGEPNFTLVMIDGIPVNDITNLFGGSFDFSNLSTDNIQQIEIVRGPLSSLYGSEAISGVINIISRHGEGKPSYAVQGLVGNFASRQLGVGGQGERNWFHYSFGGSYLDVGEQVEKDQFSLGTISFTSDFEIGSQSTLRFTSRYQDTNSAGFPENSGGPLFSILRDAKDTAARDTIAGIQYEQKIREGWSYSVDADVYDRDQTAFTPAILDAIPPSFRAQPSISSDTNFQRTRLRFLNEWSTGNFSTAIGLSLRNEDGRSTGLIADFLPSDFSLNRTTVAFAGELNYLSKKWNANFGFRIDDTQKFNAEVSPRFGLSYLIAQSGTRIRTSWGEGFKLPSFFALGEPNAGNPLLKPERSRGFDLGFEQELYNSRLFMSLTYYHNSFRDLIDFSPEIFKLVNRSLVTTHGFEFETRYQPVKNVDVAGQMAYLNVNVEGSDEHLRDRPRWRGGIQLDWQFRPESHLQFHTIWVGSRFDFQLPIPERQKSDSYFTANLVFSQRIQRDWTVFLRIENLFDDKFQEFIGFPNPGRYARFGVNYRIP
jgi:vitamin B12 transporter